MKNKFLIVAVIAAFSILMACTKEKDFVADNASATDVGYRPVSSNPLRIIGTAGLALEGAKFTPGTVVTTELQYFSESPIKEVNLYSTVGAGARTKIITIDYKPTFSAFKGMDTLLVPYTMPAGASATKIKLDYEILNQNTLSIIRTANITIQ